MGFHPDFTGRQNAFMAGQLLGLHADEIAACMPAIEAFAEIGDYIDQPVRVYSSGMQMRLAFSVATAHRPDVLIVDEALSVGDAYFQHKSFSRIREFREQGTTLLIVSHDRLSIQALCDRAILLHEGRLLREGEPEIVMDFYHALMAFVVPLVAAERLLTSSGQVTAALKPRLARWIDERWFTVVFAAACGVVQTANSPSILHTVGSTISTSGFVLVLVLLWKRATRGRLYLLSELLPRGREFGVLVFLLATQYIGLGILLRPEKLPGIVPQANIWGCYGAFILLLVLSLKRQAAQVDAVAPDPQTPLPWQQWLLFAVVFSLTSTAFQPLAVFLKIPIFLILWAGGIITGWVLLVASVLRVFRPRRATTSVP